MSMDPNLQDIFGGPSLPTTEARGPPADSAADLGDFDDIFGEDRLDSGAGAAAGVPSAVANASSFKLDDDFEDIFGESNQSNVKPKYLTSGDGRAQGGDGGGSNARDRGTNVAACKDEHDEFLDFLNDDQGNTGKSGNPGTSASGMDATEWESASGTVPVQDTSMPSATQLSSAKDPDANAEPADVGFLPSGDDSVLPSSNTPAFVDDCSATPHVDPLEALRELLASEGGRDVPVEVEKVRGLCVATGRFLPHELRASVWGYLLGRGGKVEEEERVIPATSAAGMTVPLGHGVAYKLELKNDSLALAHRLCAECGNKGNDPAVLAGEIEEVILTYCLRQGAPYEPVLSGIVGPLFSLGLSKRGVAALLYPLTGALTLFLGRGLSPAVRALAAAHAHRRFHNLCSYHHPVLVQHLDR
ncbi:unnamed protein product [Discosporangium mesarthrocarpum]